MNRSKTYFNKTCHTDTALADLTIHELNVDRLGRASLLMYTVAQAHTCFGAYCEQDRGGPSCAQVNGHVHVIDLLHCAGESRLTTSDSARNTHSQSIPITSAGVQSRCISTASSESPEATTLSDMLTETDKAP